MRDIRFRAWDKKNKEMLYEGFDIDPKGNIWMNCLGVSDLYILMQYTGLKDKNGKEIYEGDLVKTNDGIARIYWHDFRCGFEALWIKLNRATFDPVWWNAEIIGNIHQTPELLKEEL